MTNLILTEKNDLRNKREQYAVYLCNSGFSLLPLRPASKKPYTELLPVNTDTGQASWNLYKLRKASEAEVKNWFTADPNCNYGIITGPASNLYILDVDSVPLMNKTIGKKLNMELPLTVTVETGRGFHYYFKHNVEMAGFDLPFGELKGAGGYVVGPGSQHENGKIYEFVDDRGPDEVEIEALPKWLSNAQKVEARRGSEPILTIKDPVTPSSNSLEAKASHRKNSFTMRKGFEQLKELNADPETAFQIMNICGRKVKGIGKAFPCPIPGHSEQKPSAALYHEPGKAIILHDFHEREAGRRFWPLVDVYASVKVGKALQLREGERAIWWLRALHEIGAVNPGVMARYELPKGIKQDVITAYNGFCYLLELRQLYEPSNMAPFNRKFAARWCSTDTETIRRGMYWLLRNGYLYIAERGRANDNPEGPALTFFAIGRPRP